MRMAVWLLMCAGCAAPMLRPGDAYIVGIDPAFTADERAGIDASLQDWRAHVPVLLDAVDESCSVLTPGAICIRAVDHAEVLRHATPPRPTTWACTTRSDSDGSVVYLDASRYGGQEAWKYGVTHELGHAMGLMHDHDSTVMCWDETCGAVYVTDDDVRQWYRLR